MTMTFWRARF